MGLANLLIPPIQGMTATARAQAISAELFAISRPQQVRQPEDVSAYLFGWHTHPTTGEAILQADTAYIIKVHPQNNLNNLISLMPALPEQVKAGLATLIQSSNQITFGQLLTGDETILSEAEMQAGGWYQTPEE